VNKKSEYRREELGSGVRGKYLDAYHAGTNLSLISADVAKVFDVPQMDRDLRVFAARSIFAYFPAMTCLLRDGH